MVLANCRIGERKETSQTLYELEIEAIANQVRQVLPDATDLLASAGRLVKLYEGARGYMLVDVVASRRRNYDTRVVGPNGILTKYRALAPAGSIAELARAPLDGIGLMESEPETLRVLAAKFAELQTSLGTSNEEETCLAWGRLPSGDPRVSSFLEVHGIGPALLEYLRMLCGADTIKVDVRVLKNLESLGLPVSELQVSGVYRACQEIAAKAGCTLTELDQLLWNLAF